MNSKVFKLVVVALCLFVLGGCSDLSELEIDQKKEATFEGIDLESSEELSEDYSKDKNFVYFEGEKLLNSSPSTFRLDGYYGGEDENNLYYNGIPFKKGKKESLEVEWVKKRDYPDFDPFRKHYKEHTEYGDTSIYTLVGHIKTKPFKDWYLVLHKKYFGYYGGTQEEGFFHILVNPRDKDDYGIILLNEYQLAGALGQFSDSKPGFGQHLRDNLITDFYLSGIEPPEEIIVDKGKGPVRFSDPQVSSLQPSEYEEADIFDTHTELDHLYTGRAGAFAQLKDGLSVSYSVDYSPYLDLTKDSLVIRPGGLIWNNGETNKVDYMLGHIFHCLSAIPTAYIPNEVFELKYLRIVGKTKKGDDLYAFSNMGNDFFRYIVKNYYPSLAEWINSDSEYYKEIAETEWQNFLDKNEIVFWKDPLGRWIKLRPLGEVGC